MANPYDRYGMFGEGIGIRPSMSYLIEVWGTSADALVDNALFAWDATAVTPTLANIGGRPCINLTNSGSTATDGAQAQVVAASVLMSTTNKRHHIKGAFRCTTADQDLLFGFAAVDTSLIASEATDFIGIRKLAAATSFSARARKASGTAETWTIPYTIAVDTWYDFTITCIRTGTGQGQLNVRIADAVEAGNIEGGGVSLNIATQFPDTVALAPAFGFRAGSAANVSAYINYFGALGEA